METVDAGDGLVVADIGGRPVAGGGRFRRRMLYRISGGLVGAGDLAHLGGLGLRLLVDLRGEAEDREQLVAWAAAHDVAYLHAPITLGDPGGLVAEANRAMSSAEAAAGILRSIYRRILDEYGATLASVAAAMAGGLLPAGFGCAAGKDRTGVLAALLQATAGVDEDGIVEDYRTLAPDAERLRGMLRRWLPDADTAGDAGLDTLLGTDAETMRATLAHLHDGWGGPEGFLVAHGMTPDAVDDLRRQLTGT